MPRKGTTSLGLSVPELEQRLSSLQSQIEKLRERSERNVPPDARRLSEPIDEYAAYLKQWAHTVERHTRAVTQLEAFVDEWKHAGTRVEEDSSARLAALDALIERERAALKGLPEDPIAELRAQAANL